VSFIVSLAQRMLADQRMRFLLVGGVNTLFALVFYPALLWAVPLFQKHYLVALGIAQACNILFSFSTQKLLVFRASGGPLLREFATFLSFNLGVIVINWIALPVMVERAGADPAVSQIIFTVFATIGSYLWHSKLTFRAGPR
jgi:putative flippase GtrA